MTPRERGLVLVQIGITFLAFLLSTLFMLFSVHPAVAACFRACALLSAAGLCCMGAMLTRLPRDRWLASGMVMFLAGELAACMLPAAGIIPCILGCLCFSLAYALDRPIDRPRLLALGIYTLALLAVLLLTGMLDTTAGILWFLCAVSCFLSAVMALPQGHPVRFGTWLAMAGLLIQTGLYAAGDWAPAHIICMLGLYTGLTMITSELWFRACSES